ncbi:MAG: hypothetical protein EHM61_12360 [Acidobacteria bacterium]|nr:MAG: hypothetical protein EHM61_12360 [Acidobacteriota bacterium]
MAAFLLFVLVGFAPAALAQDESNTTPQDQTSMLELAVRGQLKSVDPDAKKLVVTDKDGADVEFSYDEKTEYSGQTVEGIANSSGSQVRVFFREENGQKIATKVEVQASNETEPSASPEQPQSQEPQGSPSSPDESEKPSQDPGQEPPAA